IPTRRRNSRAPSRTRAPRGSQTAAVQRRGTPERPGARAPSPVTVPSRSDAETIRTSADRRFRVPRRDRQPPAVARISLIPQKREFFELYNRAAENTVAIADLHVELLE